MYTDPVALQPRTEPNATEPTNVDATLAAQNLGLLEVRSVYDTDGLGRMGDADAQRRPTCRPAAPRRSRRPRRPTRPTPRSQVADLVQDEGPGRPGLRLRAGALRPRRARRRAAGRA